MGWWSKSSSAGFLGGLIAAVTSVYGTAAARVVSPFMTASEYLAARGPDRSEDCLTATYSVSRSSKAETRVIVSCPTFLSATTTKAENSFTTMYDFALDQIVSSYTGMGTLVRSTNADAYLNRREMDDAKAEGRALKGSSKAACLESSFHLPFAGDSFVRFERSKFKGGESFSVGGEEVIRVGHGEPLSKHLAPALRRMLVLGMGVHPRVADAVVDRGAVPKTLLKAFDSYCGKFESDPRSEMFDLEGVSVAPSAFPMTAETELDPIAPDFFVFFWRQTELSWGEPSIEVSHYEPFRRAVLDGPSPDFEGRLAEMENRLKAGDPLGAYLAGEALMWTYERDVRDCDRRSRPPRCARLRAALEAAASSGDPDVIRYVNAKEAERLHQPKDGLEALDAIKPRDDRTANRMMALRALLLIELRDQSAPESSSLGPYRQGEIDDAFGLALLEEPAMTAILYRAGAYVLESEPGSVNGAPLAPSHFWTAWSFFDAARAMPQYRGGLAERIDAIERENRRLMPYLFPETSQQQ